MSCILHVTGRVGQVAQQENSFIFSVGSLDYSRVKNGKAEYEWTTITTRGPQAVAAMRLIQPNDYVHVVANKITETMKDENGNEISLTKFVALDSKSAIERIYRFKPWKKKPPAKLKKEIDKPDSFALGTSKATPETEDVEETKEVNEVKEEKATKEVKETKTIKKKKEAPKEEPPKEEE